jgi:hypothetical protein
MCTDALVYRDSSGECSGPRPFARRGGIAKRGEGSPSTTPPHHKKEAEPAYFQSQVRHENNEEIDSVAYPPSPPLSPKTTAAPLKARKRQRVERKRDHPYQQPPSNRRPSWRPNLKQEFLRRGSIDSIIASFDEAGWFEPDCEVPSRRRRSSARTTGARTASNRSDLERRKPRQQSTLLHPSSPDIESVTSVDPLYDASIFKIAHEREASTDSSSHQPILPLRKGSSLLHPSPPASDPSECRELRTVLSLPPRLL